jgi:immunity protein Imm1 of predicted polymorphic toxin system
MRMPVVHTLAELDNALHAARPRFLELWVETEGGAALCASLNGDAGWLVYLRENGDPGSSSRNSEYTGPADGVIEYRLDNGQVDEYPASWALSAGEVKKAIQHFLLTGEPAPWIVWHNDSGDGVVVGRTA